MNALQPKAEWASIQASKKLTAAQLKLESILAGASRTESPRVQLLYSLIVAMSTYAASGNATPGYMGLGLTETLALADSILAADSITERSVGVPNYRLIAGAIALQ